MCEYCQHHKELKLHRQETDTNISEIFIATSTDGSGVFIRQPKWELRDFHVRINQLTEYAYLDINYCPICGRKL